MVALGGLAFRRRDTLLGAAIFSVPSLIQSFLDGFLMTNSTVPFVAVILLFYSIGRYASPNRFPAATAVLAAGMMGTLLIEGGLNAKDSFWRPREPVRRAPARGAGRAWLPPEGAPAARGGGLMRRRLRALSERDWRAIDRLFVALLVAVAIFDMSANSKVEGPLGLNLAVMVGMALTFTWRRTQPLVTASR